MNADDAQVQMDWLRLQTRTPLVGKTIEIFYCHQEIFYRGMVNNVRWEKGQPIFFIHNIIQFYPESGVWLPDRHHPVSVGGGWGEAHRPFFDPGSFMLVYPTGPSIKGYIDEVPPEKPVFPPPVEEIMATLDHEAIMKKANKAFYQSIRERN